MVWHIMGDTQPHKETRQHKWRPVKTIEIKLSGLWRLELPKQNFYNCSLLRMLKKKIESL